MTAPMVLDGLMNSVAFQAYVKQVLVPTLRHGDTVIMDNSPFGCFSNSFAAGTLSTFAHKGASVRRAIKAVDATLRYLPVYSPTLIRSRTPSSKYSCAKLPRGRSTTYVT